MHEHTFRARGLVATAVVVTLLLAATGLAFAINSGENPGGVGPNSMSWTGQGADNGVLQEQQCDASQTPSGAADEPYLYWVMTTDGGSATDAVLNLSGAGSGSTVGSANAANSQWRFVTPYFTPDDSLGASATFTVVDPGRGDWVLTLSHGCPGGAADPAGPLTVSKTATGSMTTTYTWDVTKSAEADVVHVAGGSSVGVDHAITTTHDGGTAVYTVSGLITITNPNSATVTGVDVTDTVDNGGECTIDGGGDGLDMVSGTTTLAYECTYDTPPTTLLGVTNSVEVAWSAQDVGAAGLGDGSTSFTTQPFDFTTDTVDECVNVTDAFDGGDAQATDPATVCATPTNPTTITVTQPVTAASSDCRDFPDVATITTNDTATTAAADASVRACGDVTGGLTIGFWQNKNGQKLITTASSTSGVCSLTSMLRAYAPLRDLGPTSSCSRVGTYVTNVVKAANASGASMTAMLKAQMLATVLDVWQLPTLGLVDIDLTLTCKAVGTCGDPDTNPGQYRDTSAAFGNPSAGTCQPVATLLTYAASQSTDGAGTWYGNVKSLQEMAKSTFDTINNNKAWAC